MTAQDQPVIRREGAYLVVSIETCLAADPILGARRDRCVRMLYRVLAVPADEASTEKSASLSVELNDRNEQRAREKYPQLLKELAAIASEPCTPRTVAEVLNIKPQERVRWTKDGRMRTCGRAKFGQTSMISCSLYDAETILWLARNPDVIERWRKSDRERVG